MRINIIRLTAFKCLADHQNVFTLSIAHQALKYPYMERFIPLPAVEFNWADGRWIQI